MDLIYEGITTRFSMLNRFHDHVRMDLIYEGITTDTEFEHYRLNNIVRMDLIYEGITTIS